MPGSEDFEKLVRHCKKVANLDAERERADRRFRAIDALKDFIRKNENHEWFKAGIHAPLGPRTARCELVRYFSVFIGPGAVRSEFFKKISVLVRCGAKF